jgi:hypothetical protein
MRDAAPVAAARSSLDHCLTPRARRHPRTRHERRQPLRPAPITRRSCSRCVAIRPRPGSSTLFDAPRLPSRHGPPVDSPFRSRQAAPRQPHHPVAVLAHPTVRDDFPIGLRPTGPGSFNRPFPRGGQALVNRVHLPRAAKAFLFLGGTERDFFRGNRYHGVPGRPRRYAEVVCKVVCILWWPGVAPLGWIRTAAQRRRRMTRASRHLPSRPFVPSRGNLPAVVFRSDLDLARGLLNVGDLRQLVERVVLDGSLPRDHEP